MIRRPRQVKSTSFFPKLLPPELTSWGTPALSFVGRQFLIDLLFDNPQQVSSIPYDLQCSFKSCLQSTMQPSTRPSNTTTDKPMVEGTSPKATPGKEPRGLRWRSSLGFVTFGAIFLSTVSDQGPNMTFLSDSCTAWCVSTPMNILNLGLTVPRTGILTDLLVYSLIIPVIPYQLEALGYDDVGSKISWLLVAYACLSLLLNFSLLIRTVPVWGVSIVYPLGSSLLRGLPQPQNPPARRPHCPRRLSNNVHRSSCLLAHDHCSLPRGSKLYSDLDYRPGHQ